MSIAKWSDRSAESFTSANRHANVRFCHRIELASAWCFWIWEMSPSQSLLKCNPV
ncbi:MAG: hypothetical protein IKO09_03670 [Bacteroidales bacterium]|nr:hypothetical protein [Bacteroidales bacterium]